MGFTGEAGRWGRSRPLRHLLKDQGWHRTQGPWEWGEQDGRRASLSHHLKMRLSHSVMRLIQSTAMPTRREA